jgi:predicted phosphodiesterase
VTTTRVQLFSDLHADFRAHKSIEIGDRVEIVVVPGDVGESAKRSFNALRRFVPLRVPIVFVMGNHEYYRKFFGDELDEARRAAPDYNVTLLERDVSIVANSIRFVGATCWTDYRLFGDRLMPVAMTAARDQMNDHKRIGWRKQPWGRFRPQEAALLHSRARDFISDAIKVPHAGPTIVVTHHAPSARSVPDALKADILTAAYASTIADDLLGNPSHDAELLVPRVDYWFHGHVHAPADYWIGTTRVVCNPHGYADEVPGFDPRLIFDIES